MKRILTISIASMALALGACGKGRSKNPLKDAKVAAQDKDLQNTFQSECSLKPFEALYSAFATNLSNVVKSSRTQYVFTGSNYDRKTIFYVNADCSKEAYIFDEQGTFTIDPDKRTNENAKQIDIQSKKLEVTALSPEGAAAANAMKLCSITDWSESKGRDVSAQSQNASCYWAKVPRQDYNIYKIDADRLMLGSDSKDERKPEQRPATLESTVYTKK